MQLRSWFVVFLAIGFYACSPKDQDSTSDYEINKGQKDEINKTVGILRMESGSFCSGTLVSPTVILTAGHCVTGGNKVIAFYTGSGKRVVDYRSTDAIDGMTKHDVRAQTAYPGFTHFQSCPSTPVDLGLVQLAAPATNIKPDQMDFREPAPNESCSSVGFGTHVDGQTYFHEKRWAEESFSKSAATAFAFEAKSGNTEPGDSGGPIFCGGKIVAVNSCASQPDWFARIDIARDWITAMIERWDPEAASALVRGSGGKDAGNPSADVTDGGADAR